VNLIIDIGNSYTKVALIDNQQVETIERYEILSVETLELLIKKWQPSKSIISCVGKPNNELINKLQLIQPTIILSSNTKIPIANKYKTPNTLGLDRVAAVVGANYLYPTSDLLVIDSGTAITYDFINSKAEYSGGAISPGIMLRYKSLNQNTANLPLLNTLDLKNLIGENTSECIESGVLNGVIGEVDYFIDKIKLSHPSLKVVITGGNSDFFVNKLKNSIFVVQNLVLIGLNRILEFNAER